MDGGSIQKLVNEVREGTRLISDIPVAGGLQAKVSALKKAGGVIPDPTGIKKVTGAIVEKTTEGLKDVSGKAFRAIEQNSPELAKLLR